MHPAASIIVFTTLSGLGYGLAAVLGLGLLDPAALATRLAFLLALALISGGLISSTLHLGNPQRAWRALSQWRSSWLSREGVMAIASFAPLICSAIAAWWAGRFIWFCGLDRRRACPRHRLLHGDDLRLAEIGAGLAHAADRRLLSAVFGFGRSAQPAPLFAAAGGSEHFRLLLALTFVFLVAAWIAKILWWRRLAALTPLSTPETATGLGFIGRVRLLERPHVNENYLTREMGFRVARKHAEKLALIAAGGGRFRPGARRRRTAGRRSRGRAGRRRCCCVSRRSAISPGSWSSAGCSSHRQSTP